MTSFFLLSAAFLVHYVCVCVRQFFYDTYSKDQFLLRNTLQKLNVEFLVCIIGYDFLVKRNLLCIIVEFLWNGC